MYPQGPPFSGSVVGRELSDTYTVGSANGGSQARGSCAGGSILQGSRFGDQSTPRWGIRSRRPLSSQASAQQTSNWRVWPAKTRRRTRKRLTGSTQHASPRHRNTRGCTSEVGCPGGQSLSSFCMQPRWHRRVRGDGPCGLWSYRLRIGQSMLAVSARGCVIHCLPGLHDDGALARQPRATIHTARDWSDAPVAGASVVYPVCQCPSRLLVVARPAPAASQSSY